MDAYTGAIVDVTDVLSHYGMPRRSGRYPWGSGKEPYQHRRDFTSRVDGLKKEGYSDNDIAKIMGYDNPKELHYQLRIAKDEKTRENVSWAEELKARGMTYAEIAKEMGLTNESTVRTMISQKEDRLAKAQIKGTVELLKKTIDEHGALDVGEGVEYQLGITKDTLNTAIYALTGEGYQFYNASMPNVTNKEGKGFTLSIVGPPDMEYKDAYDYENIYHLKSVQEYSSDGGATYRKLVYPASMDSKRLQVVYSEDGGTDRDGLIEIRPGVKDLSLGNSAYAQVRILVDDKKYLKGMAVYSDDLPPGIDVRFNSNKPRSVGLDGALKDIKTDNPVNPFGSALDMVKGQNYYMDNGEEKLGLVNKCRDEGYWGKMSNTLASQFLSKQSPDLIRQQLKKSVEDKVAEFNEIQKLTNNAIRKQYLEDFAGSCDKTSASLEASSMAGQAWKVILPDPNVKDNEVYAPTFNNGDKISLVRYPHGAIFEIPELTVNNRIESSKKMIGNATDAIVINKKTADKLSGADFDGDFVIALPTGSGKTKILSADTPQSLNGYDPTDKYSLPFAYDKTYKQQIKDYYDLIHKEKKSKDEAMEILGVKDKAKQAQLASDSSKVMRNTQTEMGKISNLIVDMTVRNATTEELVRAVKHSMTVIDAEKHWLDYKKSYEENGIKALKQKYQEREVFDPEKGETVLKSGASTILTRASAPVHISKRVGSPRIDRETGDLVWKQKEEYYTDASGKQTLRTTKVKGIDTVKDASALYGGGGEKEQLYVDYANAMKDMARTARKEITRVENVKRNPAAAKQYSKEVAELDAAYEKAMRNKPKEREANMIANAQVIQAKRDAKKAGVKLSKDTIGKLANKAVVEAREDVGARSKQIKIKITPKQWEAIQAGAISTSRFYTIMKQCDKDVLRDYAMPKTSKALSNAQISRIVAMNASGRYSLAEMADAVGVSTSTVSSYINK